MKIENKNKMKYLRPLFISLLICLIMFLLFFICEYIDINKKIKYDKNYLEHYLLPQLACSYSGITKNYISSNETIHFIGKITKGTTSIGKKYISFNIETANFNVHYCIKDKNDEKRFEEYKNEDILIIEATDFHYIDFLDQVEFRECKIIENN